MTTGSVCSIKFTSQKAMDMHIGDKAHQTGERQAKLTSVSEQLASHYASLGAASSGFDSVVYGREDRARTQSD